MLPNNDVPNPSCHRWLLREHIINVSAKINRLTEYGCATLLGAMVLIIWLGVVDRYFIGANITWTEELARYLMIWAALLAVSCGAYHREHIGFTLIREKLNARFASIVILVTDLISIAFFSYLVVYGIQMTVEGNHQYATIFGMTMMLPFASVPVSAGLTVLQIIASNLNATQQHVMEGY